VTNPGLLGTGIPYGKSGRGLLVRGTRAAERTIRGKGMGLRIGVGVGVGVGAGVGVGVGEGGTDGTEGGAS
jgi:hypothetical protein